MKTVTCLLFSCLAALLGVTGFFWLISNPPPARAGAGDVFCVTPGGGSFPPDCDQVFTNTQAASDAATGGEEIRIAGGTYTDVHQRGIVTQTVYISVSLTLRGGYTTTNWVTSDPIANPTTFNAQDAGRLIYINDGSVVTVENMRLIDGKTNDSGGGIRVQSGQLILNNSLLYSNHAGVKGGGLYVHSGSATINGSDTKIDNNRAARAGGVAVRSGTITLNAGEISNNSASNKAGGVYVENPSATFIQNGGVLTNNVASTDGGGVLIDRGTANLNGGQIISNVANISGGGVYVYSTTATFNQTGGTIASNQATSGGGLFLEFGSVSLNDGQIINNVAGEIGGGIVVVAGVLTQTGNTLIQNNQAITDSGGGIFVSGGLVNLTGGSIISNAANSSAGGAMQICCGGTAIISDTRILSNTADLVGGIDNSGADLTIDNSLIKGNRSLREGYFKGGGGIGNSGTLTMTNSAIVYNSSNADGGGMSNDGRATLTNTTISNNSSTKRAGGLVNKSNKSSTDATVTLNNVTLVSNTATLEAGGIWNVGSTEGTATVNFQNTIVADNSGSSSNQCLAVNDGSVPVMNSLGYNLESANECQFVSTGDIINTNPLLGPLELNSDTYVHPLLSGSQAIDNGNSSACPTTDQRGVLRDAACDIGAFELDNLLVQPINTAQVSLQQGAEDDVLKVTASNTGGAGDERISSFELLFEDGSNTPLSSGQANALLQTVSIYQDDGSGVFEYPLVQHTLLSSVSGLSLVNGRQTITFPQITIPVSSSIRLYLVVELTSDAASQSPNTFQVTLRNPLGSDATSAAVTAVDQLFKVTSTSPQGNDKIISPTAVISADFNFDADFNNVTQTFTARGKQTGLYSGVYTPGSVIFDPDAPFKPGEEIVVMVDSGLEANGTDDPLRPYAWQLRAAVVTGTGNFKLEQQSLGNSSSLDIALGDLDNDGDIDAFVANATTLGPLGGQNNEIWLNGEGGDPVGTFSLSSTTSDSKAATGATLGDLDNDGDLDVFVTNWGQTDEIWLNNGSAGFSNSTHPGHNLGGSGLGRGMTLGDFNGDGYLDAFVTNEDEPNTIWLNTADGTGHFTLVEDLQSNLVNSFAESWAVATGDLNNDGILDVFLINDDQPHEVWFNNGAGSFYLASSFGGDTPSRAVTLGDLNNDGFLDAAIANGFGLGYPNEVWLNNGDGSFTKTLQDLGQENSLSVTMGDVNANGYLDLIFGNVGPNSIWLNDGFGQFSASEPMMEDYATYSLAIGDVDDDGDLDLFTANASPNELWLNAADSGLTGVYLPIVLKSGGGGGQVVLNIKSDKTGTISLVQIKDPDNGNAVVLSCSNISNNTAVVCGTFDPIGNYQIMAQTANCGTLQGNFNDATGGPITRRIWCD